ncbi:MAG TPA: hypothetical protein VK683_02025 [Rhizomicrobium sp.]|nr:hypothetical protein [Rhizomicrobium sp.]
MSKSDRRRAQEAEYEAMKGRLRASLTIGDAGRVLQPGSREYERELERLMGTLSLDELHELCRKVPDA